MNLSQFWIPGVPATFATKGEKPWKAELERWISYSSEEKVTGVNLEFILPTLAPNRQPLDIDNLCEPVFSVLINKLGWFGGRRPNMRWWRAEKKKGKNTGLKLSIEYKSPDMNNDFGQPFFDNVFQGRFPSSATDPEIPIWINSFATVDGANNFALGLQFGREKINIGDIATGRVKSIIDCLYPLIGGTHGRPEDWKISILQVEKNVPKLNDDSVRLSLWKRII